MNYKQHDIHSKNFYVDPELLAHDLDILKISKSTKLSEATNEIHYYESYIEALSHFRALIEDKTRYDKNLSLDARLKNVINGD